MLYNSPLIAIVTETTSYSFEQTQFCRTDYFQRFITEYSTAQGDSIIPSN